ncbi:NAD(P)/FAD-dependent oxidoreductase [Vampirovibrio sp.]|uniref:NAD(P)/FAD-dependent oxidoreductase n=1 Tax=Vampirovibrio sp. TaxID=2717857 RepID=UPI003593D6FA
MAESLIFINGGGLAGSACAIRLRQLGHPVVLIDQSRFPRRKLCGEFLGPDAMPVLEKLGLLKAVMAHSGVPIESAHLYNVAGKALRIQLAWLRADYPFALAMPRAILDTLLLRRAEEMGAIVQEEAEIEQGHYQAEANQFALTIQSTQSEPVGQSFIHAAILIDASGRNSQLANLLTRNTASESSQPKTADSGLKKIIEPYVGVQCHVKLRVPSNDLNMYFFPGGYGGVQPIGSELSNVCLWLTPELSRSSRQDLPSFLKATLGQNLAAQALVEQAQFYEPFKTVGGIHALHQKRPASESLMSVGDALLAVEPFSGFGMSHALQTGVLAANCVHQGLQSGETYPQIVRQYLHRYHRQFGWQLRYLRWVRPLLGQSFLQKACWPLLPPFMPTLASLYR